MSNNDSWSGHCSHTLPFSSCNGPHSTKPAFCSMLCAKSTRKWNSHAREPTKNRVVSPHRVVAVTKYIFGSHLAYFILYLKTCPYRTKLPNSKHRFRKENTLKLLTRSSESPRRISTWIHKSVPRLRLLCKRNMQILREAAQTIGKRLQTLWPGVAAR